MALRNRSRKQRAAALAAVIGLAIAIAIADYLIEVDIRIFIAEFIPVSLAAQWFGVRMGVAIGTTVTLYWFYGDLAHLPTTPLYAIAINNLLRFATFTYISASAARQQSLLSQLDRLAHYDKPTGILNRQGFDRRLQQEIDRVSRHPAPMSLLFADADNLKRSNDETPEGHVTGDRVIASLARILRSASPAGVPGRYSRGDEFVLLLPQVDRMSAIEVARTIEAEFATEVERLGVKHLEVGVSIGVASWSAGEVPRSVKEAIGVADASMYRKKKARKGKAIEVGGY